jgi:hypothetical protein
MMRTKIASVAVVLSPRFQRLDCCFELPAGRRGWGGTAANLGKPLDLCSGFTVVGCKQARNFGEIVQRVRHHPQARTPAR